MKKRRFISSILPCLWVLILPVFFSGCLVVPLPVKETGNARKDLSQQVAGRLEPGVTTFAEVLLQFGEPDAVAPDERALAYRSERPVALWFVSGGYSGAGGTIDQVRYLLIDFDKNGLVHDRHATSHIQGAGLSPAKDDPHALVGAAATSLGDEPVRLSAQAEWFPNLELDAWKIAVAMKGSLLLTDSNIYWLKPDQPGNAPPALSLRYDSIAECKLGKSMNVTWLLLKTKQGKVHSFRLWKTYWTDNQMTKRAVSFIQSKLILSRGEI